MPQKLFIFLLGLQSVLWAQRYQILDQNLNQGISFAKIYPEKEPSKLADIDGFFELGISDQLIRIRAQGYQDTTILIQGHSTLQFYLRTKAQETQEVVVFPGVNPALRIIEKAIANRKRNHPQAHGGFIAEQYSKFVFDLDDSTRRKMANSVISPTDTNNFEFKQFTERQAFFISETKSSHYFEPPYREKEVIEAYRVSGFTDPALSSIAQGLQSFHFYEIQLEILGLKYLSPLAPGSLKRYFYSLKDTTISDLDTTFTIFFKPKKGADFNGLTGYLYINTNGFAIEKVQAAPFNPPPNSNKVAVVQEYQLLDNNIWFPKQLSTDIYLPFIALSFDSLPAVIVGKGINVVKQVRFDPPELEKVKFQQITVETLPHAAKKISDEAWDDIRIAPLSDREKMTYQQIDSISEVYQFDQKLKLAKVLTTGKIPLGYVQLDATKFVKYNAFERVRFGLGIESSKMLSPYFNIGASGGYGMNDERFKYETYLNFFIPSLHRFKIKAFRSSDLAEVGAPLLYQTSLLFKQDAIRNLYASNMAFQEKLGIQLSGHLKANQHFEVETSLQRNEYTDAYQYQGESSSQVLMSRFMFSWAFREESALYGEVLQPKPSNYPKIQIQLEHAWPIANWSTIAYSFNRIQLNAFQSLIIPGRGVLNWNARFSRTDRSTPLLFQHVVSASQFANQKGLNVSVANTFETLISTAFYHQTQLQIFTRYTQNAWRTKAAWNEPQLGVHYAFGWGTMPQTSVHNTSFMTMDKGFHEAGILLNGLWVNGSSSFGIGVFSSFGYYAPKEWKQKLVPKLSLGYVF
ncbi:MAG: hypothetical protein RL371_891 [Bacteroidota bacterium]